MVIRFLFIFVCVCVHLLSCVWLFVTPWAAAHQTPVFHCLLQFAQICVPWVRDVIQPSHPLLPSSFAFNLSQHQSSSESALCIRWLKYCRFSFSISPSNGYSGLLSFDLLAIQGTLKSLLQLSSSKASILQHSAFFMVQLSHPFMTTGKNHSFD